MSDNPLSTTRVLPPEAFGDDGNDFGGTDLLLLGGKNGQYNAGRDKDEVRRGTKAVALVDEQLKGFTKFDDGQPRSRLVSIWPAPDLDELRQSCGDLDRDLWPNRDQDPWRPARKLPVIILDATLWHLVFSTSSFGGVKAVSQLSRATQARRRDPAHASDLPIVALEVEDYAHKNKAFGRIFNPLFDIVGWTTHGAVEEMLRSGDFKVLLPAPSTRSAHRDEAEPVAPRREEAAQRDAAPREDPAAETPSAASADDARSAEAAQARLAEYRDKHRRGRRG